MRICLIFVLVVLLVALSNGGGLFSKSDNKNPRGSNDIKIGTIGINLGKGKLVPAKLTALQEHQGGTRKFSPATGSRPTRRHSVSLPLPRSSASATKQQQDAAIKTYTTSAYTKINGYLRGKDAIKEPLPALKNYLANKDTRTIVDQANSGFTNKQKTVIKTYRGTTEEFVNKNYNPSTKVLTDNSFTSTSKDKNVASRFADDSASKFNGKATVLTIQSNHGKPIEHLSKYPQEKEVLFQPGTKFVMTGETGGNINLWATRNPPNNRRHSTSTI